MNVFDKLAWLADDWYGLFKARVKLKSILEAALLIHPRFMIYR